MNHTMPEESLPPQSKSMPSERALAVAYLHVVLKNVKKKNSIWWWGQQKEKADDENSPTNGRGR